MNARNVRNIVLLHYVKIGVEELGLGKPGEIGKVFMGFQKCLYQKSA